jgi:hypothetical protein
MGNHQIARIWEYNGQKRLERVEESGQGRKRVLLWWGVLDKFNTLLDVGLEALDASLEEGLLLLGDTTEDVGGLLGTVGLYETC